MLTAETLYVDGRLMDSIGFVQIKKEEDIEEIPNRIRDAINEYRLNRPDYESIQDDKLNIRLEILVPHREEKNSHRPKERSHQ